MQTNMRESAITINMVNPDLCKKLNDAGLSENTPYHWHFLFEEAVLTCSAFDPDGYYRLHLADNWLIDQKRFVLPSYSSADIERMLPDYLLSFVSNQQEYQLSVSDIYNMGTVTSNRLPDVFALMALKLLQARAVDLHKINLFFSQKINS